MTTETTETIERWPLERLRPHPESPGIFGDPQEDEAYERLLADVRKRGVRDALDVRSDGTILSGHLRYAVACALKLKDVPVRVHKPFERHGDEIDFIIRANTERRHLTLGQIALAREALKEIPGGKTTRQHLARLGAVLKELPPRRGAARVFRSNEGPRSGGHLSSETHEERIARRAREYVVRFGRLLKLHRELCDTLTSMPLSTVLGPWDHHEYGGIIENIALRAWCEVQAVKGKTDAGRQALTLIPGGAEPARR